MSELHPIFHCVDRKAIVAEIEKLDDQHILVISELKEDGSTVELLRMNKFDSKQMAVACERYLHQENSAGYHSLDNLSDHERVELYDDDEE